MAKLTVDGVELVSEKLNRLSSTMIRDIVMAGAKAAEKEMAEETKARRHVRTQDMLDAIGTNEYRESYRGGSVDVYPQGEDRKGARNATKAYVINYGKGRRPNTRRGKRNLTGDKFITGNEQKTGEAVHQAMQAESDRILEKIDKE